MSDRRYKLINQGLPGNANFKTSDVADGDIIMWDSTEQKWVNVPASSLGTLIDHGDLLGLADDDHTQYHNDARGDARYLQLIGGTISGGLTVLGTLAADGTITGNGGAVNIATTGSDIVLQDLSETTTNLLWYDQSISLLYAATPDVPLALRGNLRFTNTGDGEIQSNNGTSWAEVSNEGIGVLVQTNVNGYPALTREMNGYWLTANGMNTTSRYTSAVKFGSTDSAFTTENPKFLAAICGRATQAYSGDTTGGMELNFFTTPGNPGATNVPTIAMRLTANQHLRLYGTEFQNSVGEAVLSWTDNSRAWLHHNNITRFRTELITTSDVGMGASVHDGDGNYRPVGMNVMHSKAISSNYTFLLADNGKCLKHSSGTAHTWTLANDSTIPIGATWVIRKNSSSVLTIAQGTGVTLNWMTGSAVTTGNRTLSIGSWVTIYKESDTVFFIAGAGIS